MKKAFDDNVSRAKPRVKLNAFAPAGGMDSSAAEVEESVPTSSAESDLSAEVKARAGRAKALKPASAEAIQNAFQSFEAPPSELPVTTSASTYQNGKSATNGSKVSSPKGVSAKAPASDPKSTSSDQDPVARRVRLKERLRAVRENPRPEPLPATVAEAGVLAVERISVLQTELSQLKALNLALTQDLEGARRQAERATEEARSRMEEARRLTTEMEGRAKLLVDLERELAGLEEERDEALLSLQDSRQAMEASRKDHEQLREEIVKRDVAAAESLAEEERLCAELEGARADATALRKTLETLTSERDTLARQVSELTTERMELLEARKALESVHQALTRISLPSPSGGR